MSELPLQQLLEMTKPDTDGLHRAKTSLLSMFNRAIARNSAEKPLETQRTVWRQSLAQYASDVWRWETGINLLAPHTNLTPRTDWWFRIGI